MKVTIDPIVNIENMISSPARVTRHSAKAMEVNASGNKGSPSGKGGPTDVANEPNMQPQVYNNPVSMLKKEQPTPSPVINYTKNTSNIATLNIVFSVTNSICLPQY